MLVADPEAILLVGCGKMGSALLCGWLDAGFEANKIWLLVPHPEKVEKFKSRGCHVITSLEQTETEFSIIILAVKPQVMPQVIPAVADKAKPDSLIISVAAGLELAWFRKFLNQQPIVRAMPNTPSAIKQGVTGVYAASITESQKNATNKLLKAVGDTIWLEHEEQIHALTALSGCGPAYVFYMIECLEKAGITLGLPHNISQELALKTVYGAANLAACSKENPATLRENVTSPNGVTQKALSVLMAEHTGLAPLIEATTKAAVLRSQELA